MDIYVMNLDGSSVANLTNNAAHDESPDWSPDGTKIVFQSDRDGSGYCQLYVMRADGTDTRQLTNSGSCHDRAVWSPDATKIAFNGCGSNGFDVYVMNADGSGVEPLTNNPATDGMPDWQPVVAVGGIAEYPELGPSASPRAHASSLPSAPAAAGLATGAALLVAVGGWYARRRWRT